MINRYSGPERRSCYRAGQKIGVNIVSINEREFYPRFADETGLNIGARGMLVKLSKEIPHAADLMLQVLLPQDKTESMFAIFGKAVWVRQNLEEGIIRYYVGIKFIDVADEVQKRIEDFVAKTNLPQ